FMPRRQLLFFNTTCFSKRLQIYNCFLLSTKTFLKKFLAAVFFFSPLLTPPTTQQKTNSQ
ncbi:MAG: hypothetical protein ABGW97_09105, partial [Christiangramia sp.]|uniref:hypothetical protein n=1 Tax=Christiangramia sp. TaxID=1931228 RepID=UPI0032422348